MSSWSRRAETRTRSSAPSNRPDDAGGGPPGETLRSRRKPIKGKENIMANHYHIVSNLDQSEHGGTKADRYYG